MAKVLYYTQKTFEFIYKLIFTNKVDCYCFAIIVNVIFNQNVRDRGHNIKKT